MSKLKSLIKENEFAPAPGGSNGAITYQAPFGTHASPEVSQNPNQFIRDKDKAIGSASNTAKDVPNPADMEKEIDAIYDKKKVPTADQVKAGLDYELHNMIKPDKLKAKEIVLKNLRQDPGYYGELHMMNIDDKSMNVDLKEIKKNVNTSETKKIFSELADQKTKKFVVNQGIVEAMRQTAEARKQVRKWQKGDPTL